MNRDNVLSSNNAEFLLSALRGIPNGASTIQMRLDGRTPNDRRTLALRVGTTQTAANSTATATQSAANTNRGVGRGGDNSGLVEVTLGQTRVVASVTGDIVRPHPSRPAEGFLRFSVSLSPLASPAYSAASSSATASSDSAVELLRLLERCMKESRCVDTEALCIVAAEKVWSIRCDVTVVDDAGNTADACVIAALTALLSYRRPDVTVLSSTTGGGSSVVMHSIDERQPIPLHLHHMPLCVTFALFDEGALHVCDPSLDELAVSTATVSIVVNEWHQLCGVYKLGGDAIAVERLMALINIADAKAQEALEKVKVAVGRDRTEGRGTRGFERAPAKPTATAVKPAKEALSASLAAAGGGVVAAGAESITSDDEVKEKRMDSIDVGAKATDKKIAAGVRKIGGNGMVIDENGAGDGDAMEDDSKSADNEQKRPHR